MTDEIKLSRIARGWYASADGKWAVIGDGADAFVTQSDSSGGVAAGLNTSAEWDVVYDKGGRLCDDKNSGESLGWASTLREGREQVQMYARNKIFS